MHGVTMKFALNQLIWCATPKKLHFATKRICVSYDSHSKQ